MGCSYHSKNYIVLPDMSYEIKKFNFSLTQNGFKTVCFIYTRILSLICSYPASNGLLTKWRTRSCTTFITIKQQLKQNLPPQHASLRTDGTFAMYNSPICFFFQSPLYEEFFRNIISKFYTVWILPFSFNCFTSRVVMISDYQRQNSGFDSQWNQWSFFNKALYYAMLHFYLQQPGIIKMFLLYNIPGKAPLFFLYKQNIMQVKLSAKCHKIYRI
jgi:hypothetical protein